MWVRRENAARGNGTSPGLSEAGTARRERRRGHEDTLLAWIRSLDKHYLPRAATGQSFLRGHY